LPAASKAVAAVKASATKEVVEAPIEGSRATTKASTRAPIEASKASTTAVVKSSAMAFIAQAAGAFAATA